MLVRLELRRGACQAGPTRESGITEWPARRGSRAATRSRYQWCRRDTSARAYPSPGRRAPLARPEATAARRCVVSEAPGTRQCLARSPGRPSATRGARSGNACFTNPQSRRPISLGIFWGIVASMRLLCVCGRWVDSRELRAALCVHSVTPSVVPVSELAQVLGRVGISLRGLKRASYGPNEERDHA